MLLHYEPHGLLLLDCDFFPLQVYFGPPLFSRKRENLERFLQVFAGLCSTWRREWPFPFPARQELPRPSCSEYGIRGEDRFPGSVNASPPLFTYGLTRFLLSCRPTCASSYNHDLTSDDLLFIPICQSQPTAILLRPLPGREL